MNPHKLLIDGITVCVQQMAQGWAAWLDSGEPFWVEAATPIEAVMLIMPYVKRIRRGAA